MSAADALIRALSTESAAWRMHGNRCTPGGTVQQFSYWTAYAYNCLISAFERELEQDRKAVSDPARIDV